MSKKNVFYAQSGGVTAVINATACGVIETARKYKNKMGKVYAGCNGIMGALTEDLIDTGKESHQAIASLYYTPGGAFGSCRYKLKSLKDNRAEYERLLQVFNAHNIGYFFYNGGEIHRIRHIKCIGLARRWVIPYVALASLKRSIMTFLSPIIAQALGLLPNMWLFPHWKPV